jgi:hypothetical protein
MKSARAKIIKLVVHLFDLVDQRKNGRIRSIGSPSSNNKLEDSIAWWVPKAPGFKPRQAVSIEALFSSA